MLEVRENAIALLELSGGIAHFRGNTGHAVYSKERIPGWPV